MKKSILVINEDTNENLEIYSALNDGKIISNITFTHSAVESMEYFYNTPKMPEIILVDFLMNGMEIHEFIELVRQLDITFNNKTSIYIMTPSFDIIQFQLKEFIHFKIKAVLGKPIDESTASIIFDLEDSN